MNFTTGIRVNLFYILYTFILFEILFIIKTVHGIKDVGFKNERLNVRTVLFSQKDLNKTCWELNDVGLLLSRYLMEDLLPNVVPKNMKIFLDYMMLSFQKVEDMVTSETIREIITRAMADVFGGYLQSFGLPLTNYAYYEGNIDVKTAVTLHALQNDFKKLLKTDGGGWPEPARVVNVCPVAPLRIKVLKNACEKIIFGDKKNYNPVIFDVKENDSYIKNESCCNIPLPYLDDYRHPNAIAVPLTDRTLYSLTNTSSAGILVKYFETSVNCIKEMCENNAEKVILYNKIKQFNKHFHKWLKQYVLVHLHDETFFVGFYRVLPLMKTLENFLKKKDNSTDLDNYFVVDHFYKKYFDFIVLNNKYFFYSFWLIIIITLIFLLWNSCKVTKISDYDCETGQRRSIDSNNSKSENEIGQYDDEFCDYCTCSKPKVGLVAEFYNQSELQCCYDNDCPNNRKEIKSNIARRASK